MHRGYEGFAHLNAGGFDEDTRRCQHVINTVRVFASTTATPADNRLPCMLLSSNPVPGLLHPRFLITIRYLTMVSAAMHRCETTFLRPDPPGRRVKA